MSGTVFEVTAEGQMPIEGVEVARKLQPPRWRALRVR